MILIPFAHFERGMALSPRVVSGANPPSSYCWRTAESGYRSIKTPLAIAGAASGALVAEFAVAAIGGQGEVAALNA
jgi:hypothetical protein